MQNSRATQMHGNELNIESFQKDIKQKRDAGEKMNGMRAFL